MTSFTPVELTKNGLITVAATPSALTQLIWDGWVSDGATPATQDYFDQDMVQRLQNPASQSSLALRAAYGLVVAATVTASGALVLGKHNPVDATAAALSMTLPTGAAEGATIGVEKLDTSTNAVTVTGNVRGASGQSISLPWTHETLVLRADSTGSWWPVSGHKTKASLDGAYVAAGVSGSTGIFANDATTKPAYTIGNAPGSAGFAGAGTPAGALGALAIYQKFGDTTGGSNTPVTKTTQAAYLLASYYGPTADDSAEAFSTFVALKDTGTGFTQTRPVTSFESIAQVEGANVVTSAAYTLASGARTNVIGTAHVTNAFGFRSSVNSSGGPAFGTIDRYVAFGQSAAAAANGGTVTTAYGVYVFDPMNSETGVSVATSLGQLFKAKWGGDTDGSTSAVQMGQPVVVYGTLAAGATLTTTPQNLTVNAGCTLSAGGGTFMLDASTRTIVTYTAFSGTTITNASIASGSVAVTTGQALIDPAAPNTTILRVNGQRGQAKNIAEWWDGSGNLRMRFNAAGNLVTQGTSFFAANGSATSLAEMSGSQGYVRPGTQSGPGARIFSGSGAPNVSASLAGDFYLRTDTPSTANQRLYAATGANTWTGIL